MPSCQYCKTEFDKACVLTKHQNTAKYCLEIQKSLGVRIEDEKHECKCGANFTQKSNLSRHTETCLSLSVISSPNTNSNGNHNAVAVGNNNSVNNIDNSVNNINLVVNVFGPTISDLTPAMIKYKIIRALSIEDVEGGLAKMTKKSVPSVFQNENKNWLLRVADRSRKKFMLKTDQGEKEDEGTAINMIRGPLMKASIRALKRTSKPDKVEHTISEIEDDEIYEEKVSKAMLKVVPADFEPNDKNFWTNDEWKTQNKQEFVEMKKVVSEYKQEREKQKDMEAQKYFDDLINGFQDMHDGTFWNPEHLLVSELEPQPDGKSTFIIIGRKNRRGDNVSPLTKADVKRIRKMGLGGQLDKKYRLNESC